jgi:pimeloyl-ACP methyl ester carboxylesterase
MFIKHRAEFLGFSFRVYADRLIPDKTRYRAKVVMLHGGHHTGSCYLTTAKGEPGWAYRFAEHGYEVLVPDWPGHGRSGAVNLTTLTGDHICQAMADVISTMEDGSVILLTHSMGAAFGWRITELCANKIFSIVAVAPAPPGNIQPISEILSEDNNSLTLSTPFRTLTLPKEGSVLVDKSFVADKLVGCSRQFPSEDIDAYARLLTHTGSRLLHERLNVRGMQVKVQNPGCFSSKSVIIVTGSDDLEHPYAVDKEIADWLSANGALVDLVWLPDQGIYGNGHMVMMERNSDDIVDLILWRMERYNSIEAV